VGERQRGGEVDREGVGEEDKKEGRRRRGERRREVQR